MQSSREDFRCSTRDSYRRLNDAIRWKDSPSDGILYESVVSLDLEFIQLRRPEVAMPSEITWGARVLSTKDPAVNAKSTLPRLLSLSQQASAQGNPGLASKLLDRAKQSAVLSHNAAAQRCVAYQEACQQNLQPEGGTSAMKKLLSLVENGRPFANPLSQDGKVDALACVQLASWAQSRDDDVPFLQELQSTEVGEYAQLWQACGRRDQAQLQLLVAATQLSSSTALPWAALSNWLHCKLQEDGSLKVRSLCKARLTNILANC